MLLNKEAKKIQKIVGNSKTRAAKKVSSNPIKIRIRMVKKIQRSVIVRKLLL